MDDKENMSPLRYYTIMQTKKLLDRIGSKNIIVDYAMRYENPSIKARLINCTKLVVKDLFYHFTHNTLQLQPQLYVMKFTEF